MISSFSPFLFGGLLLAFSTAIGCIPVMKLILVKEARHELRQGSAGAIRAISGWAIIVFWLMATWFFATILGDWHVTGDLEGAMERSYLRLRILLEIAAALADSD